MNNRILWIEDDYYDIQSLTRPLEKSGFQIVNAACAVEGYELAQNWQNYDLILADLIIPLRRTVEQVPDVVQSWDAEAYVGIGLVKWLFTGLKLAIPVVMLSIVADPISTYQLKDFKGLSYLPKRILKPSEVKREVFRILGIKEAQP